MNLIFEKIYLQICLPQKVTSTVFQGVSGEKITKASIYKKSFQLTRNNLEDREGRLNIAAFVVDIGIWICSTTVAISL